ncbi:23S rRNA (adenine(2503)-C(2))-methyltransferase RlmN [Treponema primitia]|uniref:23S rRNA (adenine(2503)-C(2))-methyltransferase RlmN n=1 Tax=Treponema primitia TaxID=88058 RepID=UPI00025558DE|nr:23S rRNA (adenine(2503)-C(2))-methyltransferase RlmN [Treponema primitia]
MAVLSGLSPEQLAELLEATLPGQPSFRTAQIFKWIARGALSFNDMTDLSRELREELSARHSLYGSSIADRLEDPDGTVKLKIRLADGAMVEAVLLADGEGRQTACISTQAGCPVGCVFCKTGSLGFLRNLESYEIVEQFLHIRSISPTIANIVIMGMGEPLLNLEELRKALDIITHKDGIGLSKRRITLSTSGIVEGIRHLADAGPDIRLAVSLTTADPTLREQLMPIGRSNPLPELKEALQYYQKKRNRRITLETVLLGGINTRNEDIDALVNFARGLDAAVNLIPWNPVEGMTFRDHALRQPSGAEITQFTRELTRRGITVTRRFRKGSSIAGACGQLGEIPVKPCAI